MQIPLKKAELLTFGELFLMCVEELLVRAVQVITWISPFPLGE